MTAEIPVIDIHGHDEDQIAKEVSIACKEIGFFYLEGHGIPEILIENVLSASKKLFDLPLEEKLALQDKELTRGYTPMEEETLDPANQPLRGDTKEGFYLGRDIAKTDKLYNPSKLSGPNTWPTTDLCPSWIDADCKDWKDIMNEYFDAILKLGLRVIGYLALALDLPENYFNDSFSVPMAALRLLHYSSEPSAPDKGLFACGAHSDYGMITLLLTDDSPGLQIFTKENTWMDVPPRKGAFIVNLGDMLERWTNGMFRSTIHRVVTPQNQSISASDRYSIPFFLEPNFDTVVECLEICCRNPQTGERIPPKYPPTTSGQHLLEKYSQTHADFSPKY